MIKVITDSTAYIPNELLEKYDVDVISLSVILGDEIITETEITNKDFFDKLDKSPHHPTSSQPPVQKVYDVFKSYIEQGHGVVGCFISGVMSGTYSTACSVKAQLEEEFENAKIEIVDSKSNCMQLGFAALAGAKKAKETDDIKQVVSAMEENIKRSRMLFIPDDLIYLQKSGRLSKAKAIAASILKIYPILTVIDGHADVHATVRTRKKAIAHMVETFKEDIEQKGLGEVIVINIESREEANKLQNTILGLVDKTLGIGQIGPVIGAHVGPGTVGIVYYTDK